MAAKTKLNKKKTIKQKQKQKQQQSVIVKIDQSRRVVQRKKEPKTPVINQQPTPMNIMIAPPPQLSISDAMRQQQPRFISQQEQQIRQPMTQTTTRPQQTLQENISVDGTTFTDFVEDVPIIARDILEGSDVPLTSATRLTAKSLEQHNFKESRKEGEKLQDRGITQNTLLSTPNRFAALASSDEDEKEPEQSSPIQPITPQKAKTPKKARTPKKSQTPNKPAPENDDEVERLELPPLILPSPNILDVNMMIGMLLKRDDLKQYERKYLTYLKNRPNSTSITKSLREIYQKRIK